MCYFDVHPLDLLGVLVARSLTSLMLLTKNFECLLI
jgi:hypothetical protein